MLQNCWLLADFDGTIVATPHKARGEYLTLSESPCIIPVKRWLANGGNLCVITTANKRVVQQLYVPLREILRDKYCVNSSDNCGEGVEGDGESPSNTGNGSVSGQNDGKSIATNRYCGQLLLSLNTGAVLYRCSRQGISFVPGYTEALHRATEDSRRLAKVYGVKLDQGTTTRVDSKGEKHVTNIEYVRGTCFAQGCSALIARLEKTYLELVEDLIRGEKKEVHSAFLELSSRYQNVWRLVFDYIDRRYWLQQNGRAGSGARVQSRAGRNHVGKAATTAEAEWKCSFVRKHKQMFVMFGFIHVEVADAEIAPLAETLSVVGGAKAFDIEKVKRRQLREYAKQMFNDDSDVACIVVRKVMDLLGATIPKTFSSGRNAVAAFANRMYNALFCQQSKESITQVLALGVPMKIFPLYFEPMQRYFAAVGVTAIPQPNSVAFGKLGICKSTTVRYLTDESEQQQNMQAGLCGVVDLTQAIALGDNPHTADYELTVHPGLRFISLEKAKQRRDRHTYIDARCTRADSNHEAPECHVVNTNGDENEPQPRGMLMDDRRVKNIYYVGGEEDGTAVFLDRLMDILGVPPGFPNRDDSQQKLKPLERSTFAEAVLLAATQAAAVMNPSMAHL
ncbi:hypothetical protein DPX39_110032800 [Trypanosoma brucei equiperdum]|uniref:Uncharacterized protein n=1 Tax=Trypanosoma brucei equiperdum TaxID=630700 RepID=A0A3L6KV26_9TRYP|nr:hypothetical protein DPX39_110032800 [Trypanosoma brucei equiperdum]